MPLIIDDAADAASGVEVRVAVVLLCPVADQRAHTKSAIAVEDFRHHLTVPRLKNMQRYMDVRKQDKIGQWKKRQDFMNTRFHHPSLPP